MDSLRLRQEIGLIFIVTENLKLRLLDELKAADEEIQRQIDQFDFRARHALAELQRADLNRAMAARQQIENEKRRLDAVKHEMQDHRAQVEKLEIGSEYPRGNIEGQVDVKVGDMLFDKIAGMQIIVKDGEVIEIRRQQMKLEDVIIPETPQPGQ